MNYTNNKFGEFFQKLRLQKNLSKEDLAKILKISEAQIDIIERGDFAKLPPFILQRILDRYQSFFKFENELIKNLNIPFYQKDEIKISKSLSLNPPWFLIISLLIIGVLLFQFFDAILAPKIVIIDPKNNSYVNINQILIKGYVDTRSVLYINKEQIFYDKNGYFEKTAALRPGLNKFVFEAVNNLGIRNTKEINIYYVRY